ncbi:YhgE/Pip family protein [Microbacterium azadirachtae]|uniref:ABC-2 family transporter protein n=1 Tax=Microbacterium azadirachtae TaxID=582680 RepID=A0A0F0KWQ6_9MICO|nr:YhgE/Pip family protein [Microbacterium azadirachtae]KJL25347.1 ABC-2 family transporter protein [Microbacterium azadirachtae]SDL84652.1 putative membrane protein [Microbacterium azadirachtae]SEG22293.1 putative membrane protein [Microbacterium azadirachtae]SEG24535.1 putative membrane protein [Microbacterium azadirachtae]
MTNRLSALIERARSHKPITALTLIGVLLLPAILGGVLVAALQDPTQRLDTMTAAIVNDDEPVTVNGQLAPLGRQLSAGLVDGTGKKDENLTWVVSNEKDATAGLKDGTYQAVVRIPKGFSAAAVSGGSAVQDPSKPAEKATISVTTAPQARAADGLIANQIAATAASTMGTEISKSTLQNVLVGFSTLGDKIGEAADGADKLANGAKSAATGAAALPDGATKLADGAGQLADGASQLSNGLGTIANGITSAQTGANQAGAQLAQGADALQAQGLVPAELSAGANGAAQASAATKSGIDSLSAGLSKLSANCSAVASATFCEELANSAAGAAALADPKGPAALAAAASNGTASGLTQLNTQATSTIAGQFRAAADGVNQLSDGLGRLADGTTQSATGAGNLATGATGLQSGATQLADGAAQLSTGVGSLATGTAGLATGLHQAADSLPKRTDSQASSLAEVVADPVKADTSGGMFGPTAIPLLAAVVLWFGGLVSFLVMRAFTARALTSRRPSALLALRAFAPAAALGAGQGLLVALVVEIVAKYDPARWWAFAGVAVLAGVAFAAVNQALVAVLGGIGRWIAAVIGVAALGAGIISTLPGWLATIAGALPTSPAATALLGDQGTGSAVAALVVWTVLALVATTLAVTARRTTSTRAILAPAV